MGDPPLRQFCKTLALTLAVACGAVVPATAQTKVTKLIVGFPPGGPVDIVARIIAEPMGRDMGQSVIVENKPGGNTFIAAEMLARSPADGSVAMLASLSTIVLNPLLYEKMPYDPVTEMAPVSMVISSPTIMVVNTNDAAADAAAFANAAKAKSQPTPIGSAGVGGTTHIALELFAQASGSNVLHVPYKGAAPVISDVINGQVPAFFGDLPGVIGHIRGGKLKALAVLAKGQSPQLPGVKTMAEQGFAGVEMENWYAVYVPAKTPPDVIARLNKAVRAALEEPATRAKLIEIGANVIPSTPEEVEKTRIADSLRMGALIKAKGIKAE
jgi:tripartite-type tricarboxylate transporter receptor subunit TctC